ncbi:universal stress protein [Ideonella azotifigens]|nr:universal stress protein [Ideonella azotifigens]MCD2344251.1 universal stress protein [Ideonella azotifigens]
MYHRILVPVDGSPTSRRGLQEAIAIAKAAAAPSACCTLWTTSAS